MSRTSFRVEPKLATFVVLLLSFMTFARSATAHDGHKPLPTRGMEVNAETGTMVLTKSARDVLDVQTAEIGSHELSQSVLAYGTLVSPWNRHALVSSPLSGRITELLVTPGQSVIAGQALAELDSPELELLELELRNAQRALALALRLVESTEASSRSGAIPQIRFIEAQNEAQQNRVALEIARAKWFGLQLPVEDLEALLQSEAETARQKLLLFSPIDGVVTHADLSVGKVINPKEHLFEVLDLSTIWLKVGVLEKDLSRVTAGQRFDLALTAYSGEIFSGTLEVIGQRLDPVTHLGTAWASLSNPVGVPPRLLPGMSGQVRLKTGESGKKMAVPLSAVIRDGAERFVLVEQEQTQVASTYQKQTVVLGQRSGDLIELHGGNVYPGDRVVTRGSHELGSFFAKGVLKVSPDTARDIALTLQQVSSVTISQTTTIDGFADIPATSRTVAAAALSGSIARILVDRGQKVRAGDVLAEIVSQEFQNLQLELLRAHLDAGLQQSVMENLREARDAVSQRRLWEAESRLNQANNIRQTVIQRLTTAGVTADQLSQLTASHVLLPTLPVVAPIDGVVVHFDKLLGHVVQPDETLFEIHDLSHVWVQGFVPERDLSAVKVGQKVRVRFVADKSEVVTGTLVRSGRAVSPSDRTMSVWIELDQMPRIPVQHTMLARLTIETGQLGTMLAIPNAAIVREGTQACVFVRGDDEVFERRRVQSGRANDVHVEILTGLKAGETVAVDGAAALQSGYAALR